MVPGLKITSLATLMMSAALFTRRSRDGWLDELDSIRGDALRSPQGGVDTAMSGIDEDDSIGHGRSRSDSSPLTEIEHPLPPARVAPAPEVEAELPSPPAQVVLAGPDHQLPAPPTPASFSGPDHQLPAPPAPMSLSGPDHELPGAPRAGAGDLVVADRATADLATPVAQPAPNPGRPHEMWHADVVLPTIPLTPDGVLPVDPAHHRPPPPPSARVPEAPATEPADGGGEHGSPFRLGRLRAVFPHGEEDSNTSTLADTPSIEDAEPQSLLSDLLSQYGDPEIPHEVVAPIAPTADAGMFARPVTRRDSSDADLAPRRDVSATWEPPSAPVATPVPTKVLATVEETEPMVAAAESIVEPTATSEALSEQAVTEPEPIVVTEPESEPDSLVLSIDADGTAAFAAGHLRVPSDWTGTITRTGNELSLDLAAGACWTVLGADAEETVVVSTPSADITLVAGSRTLTVVEADGSSFVLVVSGTAALMHPGGRLELPTGSMVLTPVDGPPQVDGASTEEIRGDAAVAAHLLLDATR